MKLYELKTDRRNNTEWSCILTNKENQKYNVVKKLENNNELKISKNEFLTMYLLNIIKNKNNRKEIPFEADLINWTDDITLNAYKSFAASVIIVSKRFKEFLVSFNLPKHSIYKLRIINPENKNRTDNYYMLHIKGDISDYTDFTKCEYTYSNWETDDFITTKKGLFNSIEEFQAAEKLAFDKDKIQIKISKRVLNTSFDLLWGYTNSLRINEKINTHLKKTDFIGIKTKLFKDYQIIDESDYII